MSSDTLRGIGQEGDGDGGGEARNEGVAQAAAPGVEHGTAGEQAGEQLKVSETPKDHSLDSTMSSTALLDSRVPDAPPSLNAKVSTFAATLLGVPAPVVDRNRGTVQGRDVHLPAEAQRSAGLRPVASIALHHEMGAPVPVEHSEPTQADSVVGAAVARASVGEAQVDRDSHGPWYNQLPTADDVYDDPKPNILARVAIGAALAAVLSIVIFGFVRLRARNGTTDEAPVGQVIPAQAPAEVPSPTERSAPMGTVPSPPPALPPSSDPAVPVSPTGAGTLVDGPRSAPTAPPYGEAVDTVTEAPLSKRRSPTTRTPTLAPSARPTASRGEAPDATGGTHQYAPSPTVTESRRVRPPSGGTAMEPAAALAVRPQVSDAPASPPTARATPSDKQKPKPAYDPDSTLPLTIE